MARDLKETPVSGIPLNVGQPRSRYAQRKRKKSAWAAWLQIGGLIAIFCGLIVVGWLLIPQQPKSVKLLPITDQMVRQGERLRMQIPVQLVGYEPGEVLYSLRGAPPDAKFDPKTGVLLWAPTTADKPRLYQMTVKVVATGSKPMSDQQTFTLQLREKTMRSEEIAGPSFEDAWKNRRDENPFDSKAQLPAQNKIDELVFARLEQLKIEPAAVCSDAVFLRRAYLDVIGTLPTAEEAKSFLENENPKKRAELIDYLLQRPEYADYWAMKWSDLLRVKAEFPINLWPNAAQAYHRWIRTSLAENMPYDRFARELLTSCGSNFRTPQVNFYRALQSKQPPAIAQAVALLLLGQRADKWPEEKLAGMAVFFSQIGYKGTGEWKEEIVVYDPRKVNAPPAAKPDPAKPDPAKPAANAPPPKPVFPDGTVAELPPGRDPREVFADWLIDAKNPWFARQIVNRMWYWLLGRGIIHEPDDIRDDNPPQNPELLDYLASELVQARYDLKHIYRLILNSKTYQLSCIAKSNDPAAAANFAFYPMRRLEAEVLIDAICQITGTTESYSSMIPEPFTFIPEDSRSIALPDGSITSSFLEMFGRPPRDTGMESERNNRITAAQSLHLLNSTHIRQKLEKGPKIRELYDSSADPNQIGETIYLTILSRRPSEDEAGEVAGQCGSAWGRQMLAWALINSEEFLFRH